MNKSLCTHLRVRDKNDYKLNVPDVINFLEDHLKIDFRSLPDWERILVRLHAFSTDRDLIVQEANARKQEIIQKLLVEFTRPTPYELTEKLARTRHKWEKIEIQVKNRMKEQRRLPVCKSETLSSLLITQHAQEQSDMTLHQNTEVSLSGTETREEIRKLEDDVALPFYVITNEHNLISPLSSNEAILDAFVSISKSKDTQISNADWERLDRTKLVVSAPKEIILKYDHLEEQVIKFALTNKSKEFVYVRYHTMPPTPQFKYTKIVPVAPPKLCPGIPTTIKLIFKLVERRREFTSELFFKVGKNVYNEFAPTEMLGIPVITKFIKSRNVQISEAVYIPPLYQWHMKNKYPLYPKAFVKIEVKDDRVYHLHIEKNVIKDSITSLKERRNDPFLSQIDVQIIPEPEIEEPPQTSTKERKGKGAKKQKDEEQTKSQVSRSSVMDKRGSIMAQTKSAIMKMNEKRKKAYDPVLLHEMTPLAEHIVELALETFLFDKYYLFLKPNVKVMLPVYLTKIEHIGSINCYYNFKLMDPAHDELVLTKLVRIFADILPSPIQIEPPLLLVMDSKFKYGFWKDHFNVHNRDIIHKVAVKIKICEEMRDVLTIAPMESIIPNLSSVEFTVKFCSQDSLKYTEDVANDSQENVQFSIQIQVVFGPKYLNHIRPIPYEIIVPCVSEFKKNII